MGKSHSVVLKLSNQTDHEMTLKNSRFFHGRLSNGFGWPKRIARGENQTVSCYERDGSLAGCSGFVTYTMGGTDVTIAFSNPAFATNTLSVGITGTIAWGELSNHEYAPFSETITLNDNTILVFNCQCSSGGTNFCSVTIANRPGPAD